MQFSFILDSSMVVHKCNFDGTCRYENARLDILNRHIQQKHLKKRKQCECGSLVAPSGYARHKKYACKSINRGENNGIKSAESSNQTSAEPFDRISSQSNDRTEEIVKIQVTLHVSTSNDGHILIRHDEIEYEGVKFALVPLCDGKLS